MDTVIMILQSVLEFLLAFLSLLIKFVISALTLFLDWFTALVQSVS